LEKIKDSGRVTFSLWETTTPDDDNHLLPAQFTGRILAFAHSFSALYLRLRYDSRSAASTRCLAGVIKKSDESSPRHPRAGSRL